MRFQHRGSIAGVAALTVAAVLAGVETQALMAQTEAPQWPETATQPRTMTFAGTVAKRGNLFVLLDSSGAVFQLDNSARAARFEGKPVTVTGRLDPKTRRIHVDTLEGASA